MVTIAPTTDNETGTPTIRVREDTTTAITMAATSKATVTTTTTIGGATRAENTMELTTGIFVLIMREAQITGAIEMATTVTTHIDPTIVTIATVIIIITTILGIHKIGITMGNAATSMGTTTTIIRIASSPKNNITQLQFPKAPTRL